MSGRLIVKRYVKALVLAAEEAGVLDEVTEDMEVISSILSEKEIRGYCLKNHSASAVGKFVRTAFIPYVGEYTGRWITIMAENGRMAALPFAKDAFDELMEERSGVVSVLLESAHEADGELVKSVTEKMKRRLGKKVVLKTSVNRVLLGGFRLIWQNRIIDKSVRGRINSLKTVLRQEII